MADNFLNQITMYRLVLYYLAFLLIVAIALGTVGWLPYHPISLAGSALILLAACWITNMIFAHVFEAQTNVESAYITALILALIITPPLFTNFSGSIPFLIWVSVWAMASKYMFAIGKKHIFNPAAFAVALTAASIDQSASWWIGTLSMMPFVIIGGLLVVKKILRSGLVFGFLTGAMVSILGFAMLRGSNLLAIAGKSLFESPLLFFAFIMITEPLTTPPTKKLQVLYGTLVGLLFAPAVHVGSLYFTPELALLAGNIFSYAVSPKRKHVLRLKEKINTATDTWDFIFHPDKKVAFRPGQYMEWTLGHARPDNRGNRRYFTVASSPTEKEVRLGIKFYPHSSSFKKSLMALDPGDTISASQLAGDFVLPTDKTKKLVFIAGGIGVTPFRSIVKYLLDANEKRQITVLYSNKTPADIAYKDVFDEAEKQLAIKTVYAITDGGTVPPSWRARLGFITPRMIAEEVPDYKERFFYISGPHAMVVAFKKTLRNMGIPRKRIKTDFFPGFV